MEGLEELNLSDEFGYVVVGSKRDIRKCRKQIPKTWDVLEVNGKPSGKVFIIPKWQESKLRVFVCSDLEYEIIWYDE